MGFLSNHDLDATTARCASTTGRCFVFIDDDHVQLPMTLALRTIAGLITALLLDAAQPVREVAHVTPSSSGQDPS